MERIGVRELRQHASRWLSRVAAGETIEIADRGRLIAVLSPPHDVSVRDRLMATGRLIPGRHELRAVRPLAADPVRRSLTEELCELREEER
jgi:antitoxin (DNA-binding transcriptional repressor) of toxin-antitoxin stability system